MTLVRDRRLPGYRVLFAPSTVVGNVLPRLPSFLVGRTDLWNRRYEGKGLNNINFMFHYKYTTRLQTIWWQCVLSRKDFCRDNPARSINYILQVSLWPGNPVSIYVCDAEAVKVDIYL